MDELIEDFIDEVCSVELGRNVKKAFSLFEAYEYQSGSMKLMDAVQNASVSDQQGRIDQFVVTLCTELDSLVKLHLIRLTDTATLSDRIMILDALYRLQHLEDYTEIVGILTSEEDSIDKMSLILEALVTIRDQGYFLTKLDFVDDHLMVILERFIDKKRQEPASPTDPVIIERLKVFAEAVGKDNIGTRMMEAGMMLGLPIQIYLSFTKGHVVIDKDPVATAKNILSIFYLSDLKEAEMINTYRQVSEHLFKEEEVGRLMGMVEAQLLKLFEAITLQRTMWHEKDRLSQSGT